MFSFYSSACAASATTAAETTSCAPPSTSPAASPASCSTTSSPSSSYSPYSVRNKFRNSNVRNLFFLYNLRETYLSLKAECFDPCIFGLNFTGMQKRKERTSSGRTLSPYQKRQLCMYRASQSPDPTTWIIFLQFLPGVPETNSKPKKR